LTQITNNQDTITNNYNSFGKRTRVTEDGVTTKYLYDGMLPIIEKDASDSTIATYTRGLSYGGGIGGIISANRGGNNYYYHYNGIGGVTGLTDETAAVVATYDYDSYGNTLSSTGSIPNPYGFSTKEYSNTTGLAYFGFRYYNPQTGRWLSPDPLGMIDGPNLYAYVNNNPVNWIDPWGFWYVNINITGGFWGGITGGVIISNQGVQPYVGGGLVTPGASASVTWSSSNPTAGWNVSGGFDAGVAYQSGYSYGNSSGWSEIGGGWPPGASLTGYYVFPPSEGDNSSKTGECNSSSPTNPDI
jgi:RHS repeat-associated protein